MRVLIVHPHMSFYGGAELVIVNLANYLANAGVKVTLLTLNISSTVLKEFKKDVKIVSLGIKTAKGLSKIAGIFLGIKKMRQYVYEHKDEYDIINVHNFPAEYSVHSKKCVWMCNEPPIQLYLQKKYFPLNAFQYILKVLDRAFVRNKIGLSVVSDDFNAARFINIYGVKPKIINYGIDYDFFSKGNPSKAIDKFGLKGKFVVLQVGTITPLKNQIESVKAISVLKQKIPNIKLVLAGLGEERYMSLLKEYIRAHKLDGYVLFTGHLDRQIVRDLYAACDVSVFPIKSQGGWLSPFEALCSGKPIIVSKYITCSDIIKKNKIGIVTVNLSDSIYYVYKHKKQYDKIGKNGARWVKNNLNWNQYSKGMYDAFKEVVSGNIIY